VNLPSYPAAGKSHSDPKQPGWYPLRPLTVGEILRGAAQLTRRHFRVLGPIALLISLLSASATVGLLSAGGVLRSVADGSLLTVPAHPTPEQAAALWGPLVKVIGFASGGLLISLIGAPLLAAVAVGFAASSATQRSPVAPGLALARLKGRWALLLATSAAVAVLIAAGLVALVVPGVMLWLILMPVGPVIGMERLSFKASMRRAAALSRGFKGRILGVTVLALVIESVLSQLVSGIVVAAARALTDPVHIFLLRDGVSVLISMVTLPWLASVTAMLYIDIRMRREGLARALYATIARSDFS